MGFIRRVLGYATIGAAKESARRALESEDFLESSVFSAQTGILAEAAKCWLEGETDFWTSERQERTLDRE